MMIASPGAAGGGTLVTSSRRMVMRGSDVRTEGLFSYVSCEARVPDGHPLRPIRTIVDEALEVLSPAFSKLYSQIGRPSIPPEKLLLNTGSSTFQVDLRSSPSGAAIR